ncbi:hypothetical protein L917_11466 [Phytophthora nicotianae]|uniref:Crinkler effector protein N-terminal domain-containing protein n=1 Tax=Phytophthora nicotianae TaxID=4792 RepID=W2KYH9_PHYNI|nr:hypothetical protein L917_11466 [Phytophthora nicotianae]
MKVLVCVVIGDRSVFVMGIDERKKVGILKDMIKEKNSYSLPFKEGVVTTVISDMMKNQMDPSYRVRNTDAYAPDEDAAEDGEIHVLVKVPEVAVGTTALWLNIALWYDEDKTLCIHIKFEANDNALRFEMLFAKKD